MSDYGNKPTLFKGIKFRSRLEARWAAMFDLLGWAWEYEPDCDGAYIPDFLLHGLGERCVYVEVKPLAIYKTERAEIIRKAEQAINGAPFMVVTNKLDRAMGFDTQCIGYLPDSDGGDDNAVLFKPGLMGCGLKYDFAGEFGVWRGWLTGAYDGNALFEGGMLTSGEVFNLWSRAGNVIQWKPPTP